MSVSALILGNKKRKFLIIFMVLILLVTGCRRKENESLGDESTFDSLDESDEVINEDIEKISKDLTTIMLTEYDYDIMEAKFRDYKENINDTTYLKYFNTQDRITAVLYEKPGEVDSFNIVDAIHTVRKDSLGNNVDIVYVIYKCKIIFEDTELDLDTDIDYINMDGVNKFTFRENILVDFEKVI